MLEKSPYSCTVIVRIILKIDSRSITNAQLTRRFFSGSGAFCYYCYNFVSCRSYLLLTCYLLLSGLEATALSLNAPLIACIEPLLEGQH